MPAWANKFIEKMFKEARATTLAVIFLVTGMALSIYAMKKGVISLPGQSANAAVRGPTDYDQEQDKRIAEVEAPIEQMGETLTAIAKKLDVHEPRAPDNWFKRRNGRPRR